MVNRYSNTVIQYVCHADFLYNYIKRGATLRGLPHHHRTPTREFTLKASHDTRETTNEMADEHTGGVPVRSTPSFDRARGPHNVNDWNE